MLEVGLIIGEVLALHSKDVDLDTATLTVQHGKGDKLRRVGLDAGTVALLDRWEQKRFGLELIEGAPLFCTLDGGSIHPSYIRHLLPRLARRTGIEKRVHPHGLGHAYAVELEREGVPFQRSGTSWDI